MSARRPLHGWLASEAVSLTGTKVSMIALPFFVYTTTGSAARTGLVALAELLPLVLLKILGGPVIDRLGARRVSIGCDLGSVAVVGAIPALHLLGLLTFPVFLALVALAGALRGPGDGAKQSLMPSLVAHAGVPLERATGLHGTVERSASMLGAGFAGALVATIGPTNALVVDAASFGLSAALLGWSTRGVRTGLESEPAQEGADGSAAGMRGYLDDLRAGWVFLRGDRVLVAMTVMVALTNLIDLAFVSVLVPVWAVESGGGAGAIGLLFACFSGAAALGSVVAAAWAARLPRYRTYLLAFLVCGLPRFVVLGLGVPLWAVLAVVVAAGFASGFLNPVLGAVTFERIPAPLVGRVTSLTTALCFALMPLGGLLGGGLTGAFGLTAAFLVCGGAYFLVTMLPAVDPRWKEMDRRPVASSRPEPVDPSLVDGEDTPIRPVLTSGGG